MHKIDTDTATENNEFTDGNEQATPPVAPTDLNAAWFNSFQRELIATLALSGASPDPANDAQLLDVLKKIGLRGLYSESNVATTDFNGNTVVFHTEADFTLGVLKTNSVVIIIPIWVYTSSVDHITVTYSSGSVRIEKGNIFIGYAVNGQYGTVINGAQLPIKREGKDLNVRNLNAVSVITQKRYETGFLIFENSDTPDETGLEPWRSWQLASNWELGQVRRVYCSNASVSPSVFVYYDTSGNYKSVKFRPEAFREFACIGTHTETIDGVAYEFAALIVNG